MILENVGAAKWVMIQVCTWELKAELAEILPACVQKMVIHRIQGILKSSKGRLAETEAIGLLFQRIAVALSEQSNHDPLDPAFRWHTD